MYWYPFRDIDGVKNANLDAAVNLDVEGRRRKVGVLHDTAARPLATERLAAGGKVILDEAVAIDPGKPYARQVALPAGQDEHDVRASLLGRRPASSSPIRPCGLRQSRCPRP